MSLEEFNYIAEIIASIAVIASLLYVGLQVKQSTVAAHSAAAQANVTALNECVGLINASDKLADILQQGADGLLYCFALRE